jgi:4-amino-4-deoxy-L-arabinose transferase-like glycosyltransferase
LKVVVLVFVSYVLLIHNLGSIALWDPDEPRQAIMAREMVERNDFIRPYLNGEAYLQKPPLYSWMIIGASRINGEINEFSARIPAALSAICLLLITYALGSMLVDRQAGFLSALVLTTNYQVLANGRESVMDMTFALFIGLTILLGYRAQTRGQRWQFALALLPSALAVLAKGPAGLVLPAAVLFVHLLVKKEVKRYILPLILGVLVAGAMASVWFYLAGEGYTREFILRQNITRFTHAFDHAESSVYYFPKLFFNFLPWSVLLPFSLYHAWRRQVWLPIIWFGVTFLFFEASTSKRAIYLLPLYPAAALLCGSYLRDKWSWLLDNRVTRILVRCFGLALALLPVGALMALHSVSGPTMTHFRLGLSSLYVYMAASLVLGCMFLFSTFKGSSRSSLTLLMAYFVLIGYFYNARYMPITDKAEKSPRLIADKVKGLAKDTDFYAYGFDSAGILFYAGRRVKTFNTLSEVGASQRDALLIIRDRSAASLKSELDRDYVPVNKAHYEKEDFTFYVRRDG